jgi:hypothetical protein
MIRPALFLALAFSLSGCLGDKYAAEVGYKSGEEEKWDIWGDFTSLDDCRVAAIAKYNFYNAGSSGRAVSWACLLKGSDGGYESRHR